MAEEWILKKPDGTVKQVNPFTGREVWTVAGRGNKPVKDHSPTEELEPKNKEDYCDFCETLYEKTPPEKSRLIVEGDSFRIMSGLGFDEVKKSRADFRRIGNLFEIVSYDYWSKNYNFKSTPEVNLRKEKYLKSAGGLEHVLNILDYKLKLSGLTEEERASIALQEKLDLADNFFAGGHELIVPGKHFTDSQAVPHRLCSSGELTSLEHFYYTLFTIDAMKDICRNNRYVRYISVFQNWLKPAGASFNHLHKQMVAIDEWGTSIERELDLVRKNPNVYNQYAANYAAYKNLIFAENDYAIAFADFGHRFPTLAIYSKSDKPRIFDMEEEEIRGMSDIIHGCHAAMSVGIPCNEEWYYAPFDSIEVIPWHILIKWRVNTPAGFEGGTKIHINTIDPENLRDRVVPRLFELREQGKIAPMKIGTECLCLPNSLKYYRTRPF